VRLCPRLVNARISGDFVSFLRPAVAEARFCRAVVVSCRVLAAFHNVQKFSLLFFIYKIAVFLSKFAGVESGLYGARDHSHGLAS